MPNFISTSSLLRKKYEERKDEVVRAFPAPVSEICRNCWYQGPCTFRTMIHQPPHSCCVYEFFGSMGNNEATLEEVVSFTCDTRCRDRQNWVGDPCPHNEEYCSNHCPVSRYILGEDASNIEDVPYDDG